MGQHRSVHPSREPACLEVVNTSGVKLATFLRVVEEAVTAARSILEVYVAPEAVSTVIGALPLGARLAFPQLPHRGTCARCP